MLAVVDTADGLLMRLRDRIAARLENEDGFTLIEVLVAAILLVVGLFSLLATLDQSRKLGDVSQHQSAASHFAEQELENWLARPYNEVALTGDPNAAPANPKAGTWTSIASSTLPTSPNNETNIANEVICPTGQPATATCPLGGTVDPISTWNDDTGLLRGYVYRFVTWVDDAYCSPANCPGTTDYKRITIAVAISTRTGAIPSVNGQGPKVPIVVSAVKADPTRIKGNVPGVSSP